MRQIQLLLLFGLLKVYLLAQIPFECVVIDSSGKSPAKPYGKAIANLGGDDMPDIFVSSAQDDGMHWYQSPDWEKKVIRSSGSWSEDCQILDIDNDSDNDVVNGNKNGLFWYENPLKQEGNPISDTWKEHAIGSDGTNIHDVEVADINGDKKPDVVIRYEKENLKAVYIFFQKTIDDWLTYTNTNTSHKKGEGLCLGDIDGDTDIDIVLGMIWLENNGDGTAWHEHKYSENMPEQVLLKIADMNQDGTPDIVASPQSSQAGNFAWYSNKLISEGVWVEHIIQANTTYMHGLAIADFNNDGVLDIHTSIRHDHPGNQDNVSIWLSDGGPLPVFTEQVIDTTGSHYSKIGDIDYDGDIDIIGANWSGFTDPHPDIFLWRNKLK